MSQSLGVAPLQALFRFPFEGSGWRNRFLVGSALILASFFIPILPLIPVCGYVLQVMRGVIHGEEPTLPPWDDWGRLGADGLRGAAVGLVFLLPGTVVYLIGLAVYLGCILVVPVLMGATGRSLVLEGSLLTLVAVGTLMFFTCVALLLWLLGAVPLPVAAAHLVARDRVAAAFHVREWWPVVRANKLGLLIDWVIVAGLWTVVYLACAILAYTAILCWLLPFVTAPALFYLALVGAAKFAQSYREGAALAAAEGKV